jgi:hypothetical protein
MARRLTHEESRAIKRSMRATPRISQRLHDGWFVDEGRFDIKAGRPPIGHLLEATKSDDGKWTVEVVDMWGTEAVDVSGRPSHIALKTTIKRADSRGWLKSFLRLARLR